MPELTQRRGLLDHLPDAVRSKILLEFIGHEALHPAGWHRGGSVKDLFQLGSASKQWSQWVYLDTPGLWKRFGYNWKNMTTAMTDEQLAALLRRVNGKEVVEEISLLMCTQMSGSGLEPLRGSTVLRSANLRFRGRGDRNNDEKKWPDIDLKAIVSIVESFPPFSGRTLASPGISSLTLFGHEDNSGKKRWRGYKDALLGLQKVYRKSMRDNPRPCPMCEKPMQVWLRTPDIRTMGVDSYCTHCHSLNGDIICDDDDLQGRPDTGILQDCRSCKKQFDFDNFLVCSTCNDYEVTSCLDCFKAKSEEAMVVCSMCNFANCAFCKKYDHYLHEMAIQTCQGCKVAACGICREQAQCEGANCNNFSHWWCAGCPGLKACSNCEKMRCKEECLTSCASCGDAFCSGSEYFDRNCLRELKNCVHCFRLFCRKKECGNVSICSQNGCVMSVCNLCVADGKAKETTKCKHCGVRICDSTGCRQAHLHGFCTRRHRGY